MRIVGGTWRGRSIEAPDGRGTRPTTDRMRETITSMVLSEQGLDLGDDVVLDAYAGSGGVGLELLSRGAASCTFCERNRRAAGVVRRNCQALGVPKDVWHICCGDVAQLVAAHKVAGGPFSVVFLDPPYATEASEVEALLASLGSQGQLRDGCLVVYERAEAARSLSSDLLESLRSRTHGGTSVDLYRKRG